MQNFSKTFLKCSRKRKLMYRWRHKPKICHAVLSINQKIFKTSTVKLQIWRKILKLSVKKTFENKYLKI